MLFTALTILIFLIISSPCGSLTTTSPKNVFTPGDGDTTRNTHLIFPGGGIFFYWQAGCVTYLREKNYNILDDGNTVKFTGASAGALCATLATTNVDFEQATELALSKAEDAGVWERPLGLMGIWGDMIETWLDELIPDDPMQMVQDNRLSLLVTEIPSFSTTKVSDFESKSDLIRCNMASVHIPLFLDGKLTTDFRSRSVIDGSFRAKPEDYHRLLKNDDRGQNLKLGNSDNAIFFDWTKDPILSDRTLSDAVSVISKEGIWDLLERGRSYAAMMEKRGDFRLLE